jgi:hypothetical protein
MPRAARGGLTTVLLGLAVIASGCAPSHPAGPARHVIRQSAAAGAGGTAAVRYLAIAEPANHRLDVEVDGYADHEHSNLAGAAAALRAEAATERGFDHQLADISFPPGIAATAEALIGANQSRIAVTERQANSRSIGACCPSSAGHRAADAGVEVQVRIMRRELGLPPPETS